jgi:hypothetical protein
MGLGCGLVMAPATDSIMGSLPPEHAGVGSAMNDTTRELGSALGVAVIGSVMSSFYGPRLLDRLPTAMPAGARDAASDSIGAAASVAEQAGSAGAVVLDTARDVFVYAMARASWVAAAVGVVGALIAWRWLPAHAVHDAHEVDWDGESLDELDASYGPLVPLTGERPARVLVDGDDFAAALDAVR